MPADQTVSPSGDSISAVGGSRGPRTARQKIVFIAIICFLAFIVIGLRWLFSGSHPARNFAPANQVRMIGLPYQAPAKPKPQTQAPPLPPATWHPIIPFAARSATPAVDPGMSSPIFAAAGDPGSAAAAGHHTGGASPDAGTRDALSRDLTPSDLGGPAKARMLLHPDMTIPAGTLIPCTLTTAINSELRGFVDCVLPAAVMSATGTVALLDKGTQIFGEIRNGLMQVQNRLFILWVRARTPDNVVISLASPAADELGRAGVSGAVDNHFWPRFWATAIYSLLDSGPQIASSALLSGNGNQFLQFAVPQQNLGSQILQQQINIPPTLEKNQGDNVTIFVARDLDFSGVYSVRATQ